jgi:hypothetical protein
MANVARVNGFSPVKYLSGAPYNGAANMYAIPTTDTTASYAIGDVVQSAGGADANGVPFAIKIPAASASSFAALGVIVGISPVDSTLTLQATNLDLNQSYIPAGTRTAVRYIWVADDPNLVFEVSAGVTATNFTLVKGRFNAGLGVVVAGADAAYAINQTSLTNTSPQSNVAIAGASVATTNTLPISLLGLVQRQDNEVGSLSRLLCRFNRHEFGVAGASNFTGL